MEWWKQASQKQRTLHYLAKVATFALALILFQMTWREYQGTNQDTRLILLVAAELYTLLAILISRPAGQISRAPLVTLVTIVASSYFLFLDLHPGKVLIPYIYGKYIQICGISLQLVAKVFMGRSFGLLPAHRGLVMRGPYRVVRHPIYAGYLINHIGFFACTVSLKNFFIYTVLYVLVIYRIYQEERLLKQDSAYQDYVAKVPYRLIPGLF